MAAGFLDLHSLLGIWLPQSPPASVPASLTLADAEVTTVTSADALVVTAVDGDALVATASASDASET